MGMKAMYLWVNVYFVRVGSEKVSEGQSYAHASQFPRQGLFTGKIARLVLVLAPRRVSLGSEGAHGSLTNARESATFG